jgi:hypothetical protein
VTEALRKIPTVEPVKVGAGAPAVEEQKPPTPWLRKVMFGEDS